MESLDLGNDSVKYIGWKAQKETWSVDGDDCKITKILIDTTTIKMGQGKLAQGQAPIWIWNEPGAPIELKEGYKKAFFISVYLSDKYGAPETGWRDWITNQAASKKAMQRLWNDIGPAIKNNKGKVAVVEITGSAAEAIGENKINVPILKLAGWTDKPKEIEPEKAKEKEPILEDDIPEF